MSNKVSFGLSDVHYAKITAVSDAGVPTYENTWHALPTAIEATCEVETSNSSQYADDQKIYDVSEITSATISLQVSVLDDDFKKDILGYLEATNGMLVQTKDKKADIALAFKFKGDKKNKIRMFFKCSVSDSDDDTHSTNTDSVTFSSDTVQFTAYFVTIGTHECLKGEVDESATFFTTAPALPTFSA